MATSLEEQIGMAMAEIEPSVNPSSCEDGKKTSSNSGQGAHIIIAIPRVPISVARNVLMEIDDSTEGEIRTPPTCGQYFCYVVKALLIVSLVCCLILSFMFYHISYGRIIRN